MQVLRKTNICHSCDALAGYRCRTTGELQKWGQQCSVFPSQGRKGPNTLQAFRKSCENQRARANKATAALGKRDQQQRDMHHYCCVLNAAISLQRRVLLPQEEGIFQDTLMIKTLPPLVPASRVLLGRGSNSPATLVLNWHREMSGVEKKAVQRSCWKLFEDKPQKEQKSRKQNHLKRSKGKGAWQFLCYFSLITKNIPQPELLNYLIQLQEELFRVKITQSPAQGLSAGHLIAQQGSAICRSLKTFQPVIFWKPAKLLLQQRNIPSTQMRVSQQTNQVIRTNNNRPFSNKNKKRDVTRRGAWELSMHWR